MIALSEINNTMWRRHAHPLSLWSRLLSTPLAFLPFWHRSWQQGLGVAAWFAINPWLFPEPRNQQTWSVRAIRGERRWIKTPPSDKSLVVMSAGSAAFLGGFYFAYQRQLIPTLVSTVAVMACNAWFLDRMAKTYGVAPYRQEEG